jgi:L-threonylcarbamoyladenylate synthase
MTYAKRTTNISDAVKILRDGRVVAFPTGTSYGLAVDALQGFALQRLRNLKGRPSDKAFTIFLKNDLWDKFLRLTSQEIKLLKEMKGKPLTLLVKPAESLAHLAQERRVGLRVIDHPLMKQLADAVDVPLTATSANIAGHASCFDIKCIEKSFPGKLDPSDRRYGDIVAAGDTTYDLSLGVILDGGLLRHSEPTTIAQIKKGAVNIVRQGAMTASDLDLVI